MLILALMFMRGHHRDHHRDPCMGPYLAVPAFLFLFCTCTRLLA